MKGENFVVLEKYNESRLLEGEINFKGFEKN